MSRGVAYSYKIFYLFERFFTEIPQYELKQRHILCK